MQKEFARRAVSILKELPEVIGLAAGGSFITGELDEYSDLDLVIVTQNNISGNVQHMKDYAAQLGDLVSAFTGEHVGEPRVLICLYQDPLLHVDVKFLTPGEFESRVEDPIVIFERNNILTDIIKAHPSHWPVPNYQWIEDRFWTWIHYAAVKLGRGELMEAFDFLSFIRMTVLSPLLLVKNKKTPRGVRKVEMDLSAADLESLKITIAAYDLRSIMRALENSISIYRSLRKKLYSAEVVIQSKAEKLSVGYLKEIRKQTLKEFT